MEETLIVSKNDFLIFMAEIIHNSVQTESRYERLKIIVKSAERFLDVKGLNWETVRDYLKVDSQLSQPSSGSLNACINTPVEYKKFDCKRTGV